MATRKSALFAFAALFLGASLTVPAYETNTVLHTNHLSFSGPVGLPGITLPAGTYIFERVVATNPDIVVVRSLDRSKVYFMASTQRARRPNWMARDRAITMGEPIGGAPPRITEWYPVGEELGHSFVYKRK